MPVLLKELSGTKNNFSLKNSPHFSDHEGIFGFCDGGLRDVKRALFKGINGQNWIKI